LLTVGRFRAWSLAVAAAVVLSACGGGGGESEAHAQFRKEIDRLCAEANRKGGPLDLTDPAQAEVAFTARQEQLARTRALSPPPGDIWDDAELEGFLSWLGNAVVRLEIIASAHQRGDRGSVETLLAELHSVTYETHEAARALGLTECRTA
jgi:hypothetical protein